jgi:hypothetical protein
MWVLPEYRGLGLSLMLDRARFDAAFNSGCQSLLVRSSSGVKRKKQLMTLGFTPVAVGRQDKDGPLVSAPPPLVMLCEFQPTLGQTGI